MAAADAKSQFGQLKNQVADNFKTQSRQLADFAQRASDARLLSNGGKVSLGAAVEPLIHFAPDQGWVMRLAGHIGQITVGYKLLSNPVVLDNLSKIMRNSVDAAKAGTGAVAKYAGQNQQAIGRIMMVLNSTHASESMKQQ